MPSHVTSAIPAPGAAAGVRREQVYAELSEAILTHRYSPGQRLIERELMAQYSVSRATVREAIRELASTGLATVQPQQGARVASASPDDARDLYELRSALEIMIIERFIQHASQAHTQQLTNAVNMLGQVVLSSDNPHTIMDARDQFYGALFAGAGSAVLEQEARNIQARVRMLCVSSLSESGRSKAAAHELAAVVDAISAHNVSRATTLMRSHLELAAAATLRTLSPTENVLSA